jgi:hypothetical protein
VVGHGAQDDGGAGVPRRSCGWRARCDVEAVDSLLFGALLARAILGEVPDAAWAGRVVDTAWSGIRR